MRVILALLACTPDPTPAGPPLGMTLESGTQVYAGVARVDITPVIAETYADLDGDHYFDGCVNDPGAEFGDCSEPFEDVNGNGTFDATWMGGWGGGGRAASGVHDPQFATALVLSLDESYLVLVSVDAVGLLEYRTSLIRARLATLGVDPDRVVIVATHDHQSADTVGLWGNSDELLSGFSEAYQEQLADGVVDAVTVAAGEMLAAVPTQGVTHLRDDPTLNGAPFGGNNPDPGMQGGVHDGRDPLVVDDQVFALALDAGGDRLATLVDYSGHPELVGWQNDLLSSDYVGEMRSFIEAADGGTAMFVPGALGGMQTAWNGTLPMVDATGERVLDDAGAQVFTNEPGYEFARTEGVIIAQAARAALTDKTAWTALTVTKHAVWLPVTNLGFEIALRMELIDQPWSSLDTSPSCPGYGTDDAVLGCAATGLWQLQLGPTTLLTVPGELLPELFWGVPDDPSFADASVRSGSPYFPHHPVACDNVAWTDCRVSESVDGCDCLEMHAAPYTLAESAAEPLAGRLPGPYKAVVGIANGYVGYVIPEPDFSQVAGPLTGLEGNHGEEWYSAGDQLAPTVLEAVP